MITLDLVLQAFLGAGIFLLGYACGSSDERKRWRRGN